MVQFAQVSRAGRCSLLHWESWGTEHRHVIPLHRHSACFLSCLSAPGDGLPLQRYPTVLHVLQLASKKNLSVGFSLCSSMWRALRWFSFVVLSCARVSFPAIRGRWNDVVVVVAMLLNMFWKATLSLLGLGYTKAEQNSNKIPFVSYTMIKPQFDICLPPNERIFGDEVKYTFLISCHN